MRFNSMHREEPYQGLTCREFSEMKSACKGARTQVVHGGRQFVSCDVGLSPATNATLVFSCQQWNSGKTASVSWRKERMTSSQHAPYTLGDTRNTMVKTMRCDLARAS